MNRCFVPCLSLLTIMVMALPVRGQKLAPVDSASTIQFKIKNLGFNTTGTFSGITGTIQFDPNNLAGCHFDVQLPANTVNTGVDMRDDHLREEGYLHVKMYPQISFVSVKVTQSNRKGTLFVFGKLTLKGVTKDISFPFTAEAVPDGYLLSGTFKLNRRDYNVGGGSTLGNELTVMLKVVAKKV
jgi:polyisoprenoid-binding protein YceI